MKTPFLSGGDVKKLGDNHNVGGKKDTNKFILALEKLHLGDDEVTAHSLTRTSESVLSLLKPLMVRLSAGKMYNQELSPYYKTLPQGKILFTLSTSR